MSPAPRTITAPATIKIFSRHDAHVPFANEATMPGGQFQRYPKMWGFPTVPDSATASAPRRDRLGGLIHEYAQVA
jgi:hypothetical protein